MKNGRKIVAFATALTLLCGVLASPAAAEVVRPAKAPVAHYDFKEVADAVVPNLAAPEEDPTLYAGELVREPAVNLDEGYITTNGAGVMDASKLVLPTAVFTDIETDSCTLTMYVRLGEPLGDRNRVLLGVGKEGGNEHNMFGLRVYNTPENGHDGGLRLLARVDGGGDAIQESVAEFSKMPEAELQVGVWTLVSLTQDGGTTKVYINDKELFTLEDFAYNLTRQMYAASHTVAVGADLTNGENGFIGDIGDVRVYDYALTPEELTGVTAEIGGGLDVQGVALDKTELTLTEGEQATLTATVTPDTATDKTVVWTTDTPAVATVDADGAVRAVKAGKAVVTATTADGGFTATCAVTVNAKPSEQKPATPTPSDGLRILNGKRYLYLNGARVTGTRLVTYDGATYALKNGVIQTAASKLSCKLVTIGKKTYAVDLKGQVLKAQKSKKGRLVRYGAKRRYIVVNTKGIVQRATKKYKVVHVGKKAYIVNKKGIVQVNKKKLKVGKVTYKTGRAGVAKKIAKKKKK